MDKKKSKPYPVPSSTRGFVMLWTLSHTALWLYIWLILKVQERHLTPFDFLSGHWSISAIALCTAFIQQKIMVRAFKRSMGGWALLTFLGSILSNFAFGLTHSTSSFLAALALLLPIAFVQTAWLWFRVQTAWLWPLANGVSTVVFIASFRRAHIWIDAGIMPFIVLLLALTQSVAQGVVMRYLWTQTRSKNRDKQKIEDITNETFEQEHI